MGIDLRYYRELGCTVFGMHAIQTFLINIVLTPSTAPKTPNLALAAPGV